MTSSFPGSVYMTPDQNSGIFLSPNDCGVLVNFIGQVINAPTIAGPTLNLAVLRELQEILGESGIPASEGSPPTVLPQELAVYLEILCAQVFIQATLSIRIQFACKDCGLVWIDDPGRLAQREADLRKAKLSIGIIDATAIAGLIEGHHLLLAGIRGYGAMSRNRPNSDLRCGRCKGDELDLKYVSFCPNCHKLRTETVLLECPDCAYDFRNRSCGQFWATATETLSRFKVSYKQVTIDETVNSLYKHARPSQVNDLVSEISPSERLLGICACRMIGNHRGDAIILFTSEKIVWTIRRSLYSERHSVNWNQIQEISGPADRPGNAWIKLTNGNTVAFSAFVGTGADMSASNLSFGSDKIRDAMLQMLRLSKSMA